MSASCTEIDQLRRKQYGVQLQRHGHGGVLIDVQASLSQPTLRDRRVLALASTYRSVHHHQHSHAHLYLTTTRESRHPPGTSGSPACVPSRFRPSHASHPLDPSVRLFPLAPAHFIRAIPRTTAHFTDHHRTRPVSRNNPKPALFQQCSRSLVPHAPSLAVCLSRSVFSQSSRHLAQHPPPTRTPHHHHLDPDDIVAATASSCSSNCLLSL